MPFLFQHDCAILHKSRWGGWDTCFRLKAAGWVSHQGTAETALNGASADPEEHLEENKKILNPIVIIRLLKMQKGGIF